jgi:hypothetical protein
MQKQADFQSARAHSRYLLKMWKTNAAAGTEREKTTEADLANLPPIAAHPPTVLIPRDFWPTPIVNGTLVS